MFWVVIIGNDHEFEDAVREVSKNKCSLVFLEKFFYEKKKIDDICLTISLPAPPSQYLLSKLRKKINGTWDIHAVYEQQETLAKSRSWLVNVHEINCI